MPGQIIKRGESTWLVRIALGRDATGVRKYHNCTIRGSKREAERYRIQKLRELDTGTFVQPSSALLRDYLSSWLDTVAAPRVRPRTLDDYRSLVDRYITPSLGHRKMSHLHAAEIQQLYAELAGRGLSPRTVRYVHSVLHSALEQAVKWQVLSINPAKLVALPRNERKEMRAFSVEQALRFLGASAGTRYFPLWQLLLTSGLRPGEALALKWSDLDGDRIIVQRSLSWRKDGSWELCEPKTDRARRVVVIPRSTTKTLLSLRSEQAAQRLACGPNWTDRELIFTNGTGGPLEWRVLSRRYFRPILQSAGLIGFRPYDLRHSCATLLLASGVNVKVVSERLGHASSALTLDVYSHTLPDMQQQAADTLETILSA